MTRFAIPLLLLGAVQSSWLNDEDSDRVIRCRARLEHIIRQTGPTDPRPTVLVEHSSYADQTVYQCLISDLEGKRHWRGLGDDPKAAAREAFADYWRDFK